MVASHEAVAASDVRRAAGEGRADANPEMKNRSKRRKTGVGTYVCRETTLSIDVPVGPITYPRPILLLARKRGARLSRNPETVLGGISLKMFRS